ncbi:MAG: RNA methyltransferase [Lachnospiraceae bacterium]|nr:RNA methyltransferase [Lachnospiraceae bacterium]
MANITEITDFNDKSLDIYARMTENELLNYPSPDKGIFIAESPKVVERALNAGYEPVSMLVEKKHIETEAKQCIEMAGDIPVYTAEFDVLTKLTGFKLTRGVLCAMKRKSLLKANEVIKNLKRIAIFEKVMNPTNMGAIFRSAAALGIEAVLLTPECSNPLYRRAIRVSMGTVFQVPWTYIDSEENWENNYLNDIKKIGFKTIAMALRKDTIDINDKRLNDEKKLAIILGNEGDGLMESTLDNCDYTVKIPMSNEVDSLNVAAASAIAFWEIGNKRCL